MKLVMIFISFALLFSVGACSSKPARILTIEDLKVEAVYARKAERENLDVMIESLAQRVIKKDDGRLDLLFLSGGGQNGAYGIGFLQGWRQNLKNPMPQFDLVTGVSTGALQAPFALIGTREALDQAGKLYLDAAIDFAPSVDVLFWFTRTGGVLTTYRYQKAIADTLDVKFSSLMNEAFAEGRQMAISTANFDLGIGKTWNIGAELKDKVKGLARVHQVLVASTAIPSVFPTQIIDGFVHSDGGVISNILPIFDLDNYRKLGLRLKELDYKKPVRIHLWVVLNMWTHPRYDVMYSTSRGDMASRAYDMSYALAQSKDLQRLYELSAAVNAEIEGLNMEMQFTAIPSEMANQPGADGLFDRRWMTQLRALGQSRAMSSEGWDTSTSPFERP